jgi:hypothetical protein
MRILIQVASSFMVGLVGGVIVSLLMQRWTYRRVERWLLSVEASARSSLDPMSRVEVPGYQAVIRKFHARFVA